MEVHRGNTKLKKESKSEILFCPKPLHLYNDPETYDNADLSPVKLTDDEFIPIVFMFIYLGSLIAHDLSDKLDVEQRIEKAGNAFGALRERVFASTMVTYAAKRLAYCALILSILLLWVRVMVFNGVAIPSSEELPRKMCENNVPCHS